MVFYVDEVTLLDRTAGARTASTDLLSSVDPTMTGDGDMRPWRVRLAMTNTGEDGVVNSGTIKLRVDEAKRFIQTAPILVDEDAKTKYLIEVKIKQRNPAGGADLEGKTFRFQLGSPSIDVDKNVTLLTISLQEIQYRIKETYASRELRFVSPAKAMFDRVIDFNNAQISGVNMIFTNNKLPVCPLLEYIPQSPKTIQSAFDDIVNNLSESTVSGGTFTDFYYDFDPTSTTLAVDMTADEIGRVSSGIILDPLSIDVVDAETEQSAVTDFVRYKNHVILRGAPDAGSLPTEHSRFSSNWLHAKLRDEFNLNADGTSPREIDDRSGTTFKYLKGETCKVTFDTTSFSTDADVGGEPLTKVIRFFLAQDNILTTDNTSPDQLDSKWLEDFIIYPRYDIYGRYFPGDIVYHMTNAGSIIFYFARDFNVNITLNRIREGTETSAVLDPSTAPADWAVMTSVIPVRDINNFTHWFSYSPWTESIFDWEQNMVGANPALDKVNVLPLGTNNRYVGFVPDWNMTKDVYQQQDVTDIFETVSVKWCHKHVTDPVPEDTDIPASNDRLNTNEIYHGQRVLINGTGKVGTIFEGHDNQVAEWDETKFLGGLSGDPSSGLKWRFSNTPVAGDITGNFNDGKVYQYTGSAWEIGWEVERLATNNKGDPASPAGPFHIVKDVYKTQGFEGTASNAIEFRFIYDTELGTANIKPSPGDSDDLKAKFARRNSRGAWLWMWKPFPRLGHRETDFQTWNSFTTYALGSRVTSFSIPYIALRETIGDSPASNPDDWEDATKDIGSNYGGNNAQTGGKTGFTTLNIYNTISDRFQSLLGWNNGIKTEDMGKISGISFKMKLGIFASPPDLSNDNLHAHLPEEHAVIGVANIPMVFWAVDDFDRIWQKKFTLRKNNQWDEQTIEFGDLAQTNLYLPRWDELSNFLSIPLSFTNFALKQREYTGVGFDWRFVRGWGVFHNAGYDETGFYNGGIDEFWEVLAQYGEQIKMGLWNLYAVFKNWWDDQNNPAGSPQINPNTKAPIAYALHRQATLAIDDLHFVKELVINSDDEIVKNPRTKVAFQPNVDDYVIGKNLSRANRERLSFFPQFWTLRSIGDVRMRVGQSFLVKGDRIPDNPDSFPDWTTAPILKGTKVGYFDGTDDFAYQARIDTTNDPPNLNPEQWENLNKLACAEVTHIIDHTGYHMEVSGRRKFITTGEVDD